MNSREKILKEIGENKPEALPLPERFSPGSNTENLVERFITVLQGIGGTVQWAGDSQDVQAYLQQKLVRGEDVVNGVAGIVPYNIGNYAGKEAAAVERVHTVFLRGELAVAENGAVWVSETSMVNRLLPFLCQELVLVVDEENIVATMHEAYQQIDVATDGYGVFIAGPSKTADIEQALVIGAHGPLQLQVLILKK